MSRFLPRLLILFPLEFMGGLAVVKLALHQPLTADWYLMVFLWCIVQHGWLEWRLPFCIRMAQMAGEVVVGIAEAALAWVRVNWILTVVLTAGALLVWIATGGPLGSLIDVATSELAELFGLLTGFWGPMFVTIIVSIGLACLSRWRFHSHIAHEFDRTGLLVFVPPGGKLHLGCLLAAILISVTLLRMLDDWAMKRVAAVCTQHVRSRIDAVQDGVRLRRLALRDRIRTLIKQAGGKAHNDDASYLLLDSTARTTPVQDGNNNTEIDLVSPVVVRVVQKLAKDPTQLDGCINYSTTRSKSTEHRNGDTPEEADQQSAEKKVAEKSPDGASADIQDAPNLSEFWNNLQATPPELGAIRMIAESVRDQAGNDRGQLLNDLRDLNYLYKINDNYELTLREIAGKFTDKPWGVSVEGDKVWPGPLRKLITNTPLTEPARNDSFIISESLYVVLCTEYGFPKPYEISQVLHDEFDKQALILQVEDLEERKVLELFLYALAFEDRGTAAPNSELWAPQGDSSDRLFANGRVLDLVNKGLLTPIFNPPHKAWPLGLTTVRIREMVRGIIQTITIVVFFWGLCVMFVRGFCQGVLCQLSYLPVSEVRANPRRSDDSTQTWRDAWNTESDKLQSTNGLDQRVAQIHEAARETEDLVPSAISHTLTAIAEGKSRDEVNEKIEESAKKWRESRENENGFLDFIAYSLPNLGFLGTIVGIGQGLSVSYAIAVPSADPFHKAKVISAMTAQLGTAFYTTLVALACVLPFVLLTYGTRRMHDFVAVLGRKKTREFAETRIDRVPRSPAGG